MYIHGISGPGDAIVPLPAPHRVTAPPPPLTPKEKEKEKIAQLLVEELESEAVAVAEEHRIFVTRTHNAQDVESSTDHYEGEQRASEIATLVSEGSSAGKKIPEEPGT